MGIGWWILDLIVSFEWTKALFEKFEMVKLTCYKIFWLRAIFADTSGVNVFGRVFQSFRTNNPSKNQKIFNFMKSTVSRSSNFWK